MNLRPLLRRIVPASWHGEDALIATNLLQQAIDAVWETHGASMAAVLQDLDRVHEYGIPTDDDPDQPPPWRRRPNGEADPLF